MGDAARKPRMQMKRLLTLCLLGLGSFCLISSATLAFLHNEQANAYRKTGLSLIGMCVVIVCPKMLKRFCSLMVAPFLRHVADLFDGDNEEE